MNTIEVSIEHSIYLSENGLEVYIGNESEPALVLEPEEIVEEFLDSVCDADSKVYPEVSDELDIIIAKFKSCLKALEDAKR